MDQGSSNSMWYIGGAVIVVAIALWYFMGQPATRMESTSDTSTAALTDEFNQIPDDSAALDQDAAASAEAVQGL
ncbi:MAG: hypothetical protein UY97_C0004G0028 [Parcubacteria group bacterium GW2011_GWB1_57_6]|nr:MAG: hypothetical protein UY93_C0002G0463 [Parcubacteria group bacterium GW2011_GWA1_56_13]KKW46639.1 MAG: hypothetical protein UY97_C0004G0028 [Parcubacteria group bacterium GW2011_GWB1_57_6]